jgi:hypothetical protein
MVDEVALEQVFSEFLQLSSANHHYISVPHSSSFHLMCVTVLTCQHIITSLAFMMGASSLTKQLAGSRVKKF